MSHLIDTFWQRMEPATFAFALDGETDMMSLNPMELTNFEMMGTIFAFGGVLFTLLWTRLARRREQADAYTAGKGEAEAVEQYP